MKIINLHQDTNWQYFTYDDIFIIKKGKRLTIDAQEYGNIPYISSSFKNNGVNNYIANGYTDENCLSFACYGSIGYVFYHPYKAWISDNCNVLYIKNIALTENIAMFLIPILEKERFRFSYGVTAKTAIIKHLKLKLPSIHNSVDWEFIDNYIAQIKHQLPIPTNIAVNHTSVILTPTTWQEFSLADLFEIHKGERLTCYDRITDKINIPLVVASSENNGVAELISYNAFRFEKKIFCVSF